MSEMKDEKPEETGQGEASTAESKTPEKDGDKAVNGKKTPGRKKKKKKIIIIILIIVAVLIAAAVTTTVIIKKKQATATTYSMVKVTKQDIQKTVTGSSTVSANDSYNVTALVTGEVLTDYFSEGDKVNKNDIMYSIDSTTAQNAVDTAKNALTKAQQSYVSAVTTKAQTVKTNDIGLQTARDAVTKSQNAYNEASDNISDLNVKSDINGTVSKVYVKNGDSVQSGASIAAVYNDTYMKIQIPFNTADADSIYNGESAELRVTGSGGTIWGSVTSVSDAAVATSSHAIVKYVTIECTNPGALSTSDTASATINGIVCSDTGTFEYVDSGTITAKTAGKVYSINVKEHDKVYSGEIVANLSSDTLQNTLDNAGLALNDAVLSLQKTVITSDTFSQDNSIKGAALELDNARLSLEKANKTLEDYTVKAPISGTVVTKNTKAGDKLDNSSKSSSASSSSSSTTTSSSSSSAMAVIYDLSCLTMTLSVDETNISLIQTGQSVSITADAVSGTTFTGTVTKVSVDGTTSNGVTTYPVKIEIDDYGSLLPGMNADATIIVNEAKDALSLPVSAINRGNVVYMKGNKTEQNDKAPDGFKSVKVETGLSNGSYIEIKSGVNENDEVRTASNASNKDTTGQASASQQQQGMMGGGMGGPPSGGGMSGSSSRSGGMSGGMR